MTSSLVSVSFAPNAEGNITMIRHTKDHQNSTSLKAGAGEIGSATLKINTNLYLDSSNKPAPNNPDMYFRLLVSQGGTTYYDGAINGSPITMSLQLPVAKSGKTDYYFSFMGPAVLDKSTVWDNNYWKPGDTSVKTCTGQLSDGQVATCTVGIHWGWYNYK
jgi:hypothetical protein